MQDPDFSITDGTAYGVMRQLYRRRSDIVRLICGHEYDRLIGCDILIEGALCRLLVECTINLNDLDERHGEELMKLQGKSATRLMVDNLATAFEKRLQMPLQMLSLDRIGNVALILEAHGMYARLASDVFSGRRLLLYDLVARISFPKWIFVTRNSALFEEARSTIKLFSILQKSCCSELAPTNDVRTHTRIHTRLLLLLYQTCIRCLMYEKVTRFVEYTPLSQRTITDIGQRVDTHEKFTESLQDELMSHASHTVICALDGFIILLRLCVLYGPEILESVLENPVLKGPTHPAAIL